MSCSWEETKKQIEEIKDMALAVFASGGEMKCEACDYYDWIMSSVIEKKPEAPLGAITLDMADPSCREVAENLGTTQYPTIIAFRGGKEYKRLEPKLLPDEDIKALEELCQELQAPAQV